MKKSTRALVGLVAIDAIIATGALWMVGQVRSGSWNAIDPAESITEITTIAGGAIGIATAVLLVAFAVHRLRGN